MIIKYYFLVAAFYCMELALFFFISRFNLDITVSVNILCRLLIASIAGYVFNEYLFDKNKFFILKYILALLFYPLIVIWFYESLLNIKLLNAVNAKLLLDIVYSLICYGFFNVRLYPKGR